MIIIHVKVWLSYYMFLTQKNYTYIYMIKLEHLVEKSHLIYEMQIMLEARLPKFHRRFKILYAFRNFWYVVVSTNNS